MKVYIIYISLVLLCILFLFLICRCESSFKFEWVISSPTLALCGHLTVLNSFFKLFCKWMCLKQKKGPLCTSRVVKYVIVYAYTPHCLSSMRCSVFCLLCVFKVDIVNVKPTKAGAWKQEMLNVFLVILRSFIWPAESCFAREMQLSWQADLYCLIRALAAGDC